MSLTPTSALSPLDGRYAAKLAPLRPLMSEQGYMHRRVQVEVAWLIALCDAGFAEFKPLSPGARTYLLGLVKNFSEADALAIKEIEKTTNHDVKAVEYWIKSQVRGAAPNWNGQRIRPFRLHQRGHQQHQPCPASCAPGATSCCCRRWTASC